MLVSISWLWSNHLLRWECIFVLCHKLHLHLTFECNYDFDENAKKDQKVYLGRNKMKIRIISTYVITSAWVDIIKIVWWENADHEFTYIQHLFNYSFLKEVLTLRSYPRRSPTLWYGKTSGHPKLDICIRLLSNFAIYGPRSQATMISKFAYQNRMQQKCEIEKFCPPS